MSLSEQKKSELYEYYLQNGVNHPVAVIVNALGITHKTFFNRYKSKEASVEICWQYWQELCERMWHNTKNYCNNEIEEMIMLVIFIDKLRDTDKVFFDFTTDKRKFLDTDSFFFRTISDTLIRGLKRFYIQESLNIELYTTYLLDNLFLIDPELEQRPVFLSYLLHAAFTERGIEIFEETPFAWD